MTLNTELLFNKNPAAGGYTIDRSLRFNSADSAYLSRTPASAGNRKTWTWAGWVKRGGLGVSNKPFFVAGTTNANRLLVYFNNVDKIQVFRNSGGSSESITGTANYRDPSAWYHVVVSWNASSSVASVYVNGVVASGLDAAAVSNVDSPVNSTDPQYLGGQAFDAVAYFDGYLADVYLIDGSALDPTSFGEFDTNGVWQPIAYAGSYGTNGFHLDFADNSSAAALGYDAAGSNDWTVNNLSVTAGAGNDSLRDSPTNGDTANDTGLGGEVPGNYCTWNPLVGRYNDAGQSGTAPTFSNGNLDVSGGQTNDRIAGTFHFNVGQSEKYYWEVTFTGTPASSNGAGVRDYSAGTSTQVLKFWYYDGSTGDGGPATSFTTGDVLGFAMDLSAGTIDCYKNGGSSVGQMDISSLTSVTPFVSANSGVGVVGNFGQRSWSYAAPSGFKALCAANLPTPTIADGSTVMDVVTYTGNGSTQSITGLGFSPDWVWIKSRSSAYWHEVFDSVRGATKHIFTNDTSAESTLATTLTSFDSNGFTLSTDPGVNLNSGSYVAWAWDAGSSTVANTDGSISSSVRAAPDKGFSIVSWIGASGVQTVGHGLGVPPEFIVLKSRDAVRTWYVYTKALGPGQFLYFNTTDSAPSSVTAWNNTAPSSTVISFNSSGTNPSGENIIAYCFAPVAGYSAFGSFVTNGADDNAFIYTGFRPRWIMWKRTDGANSWGMVDTARNTYNVVGNYLLANASDAEANSTLCDILSNGFKMRTSGFGNGQNYIYAAFAEHPFQTARAR